MSSKKRKEVSKASKKSSLSEYSSIPDYRVEEDRLGRLVNKQRRLIWPSRKAKKEFDEIFDRADSDDSVKGSQSLKTSKNSTISKNSTATTTTKSSFENDAFIGGATPNEAQKRIGCRSFVLYYRMPTDGSIPFSMPLMLAYRSTSDVHYHFSIKQKKQYDSRGLLTRTFYSVDCGDNLDFLSLETMIRHYETFVYHDVINGSTETFPVNNMQGATYDIFK